MPRHRSARSTSRVRVARALSALILFACASTTAPVFAQDTPVDGGEQFATLCARCHGLSGDGRGAEVLDRPARDFTAGGFSFGNTQDAIARTITHGIPGSPMPAFGETLAPEVIEALARHVRTLAPGAEEPAEAETILSVHEHPVVVRGGLPPITEGAPDHPRGLLLGLPGGLSFEYRVPDLALLGVRAGEFVRRADWTGRGGSSLEPLGQLLWLNSRGTPGATVALRTELAEGTWVDTPLVAHLRATRTPESGASISWDATTQDGTLVARIDEKLRALSTPVGAGFVRSFRIRGSWSQPLVLRQVAPSGTPVNPMSGSALLTRREDGVYEFNSVHSHGARTERRLSEEGITLTVLEPEPRGDGLEPTVSFITLLAVEPIALDVLMLQDILTAELDR